MPSRLYMLGICRQVTAYANVMKFGTVGPLGYVIALTAVGPHRLTGFGVSRHQSWVPSIDKAHRAYYTAVPATAGTHDYACRTLISSVVKYTLNVSDLWTCEMPKIEQMCSSFARFFGIYWRGFRWFPSDFQKSAWLLLAPTAVPIGRPHILGLL